MQQGSGTYGFSAMYHFSYERVFFTRILCSTFFRNDLKLVGYQLFLLNIFKIMSNGVKDIQMEMKLKKYYIAQDDFLFIFLQELDNNKNSIFKTFQEFTRLHCSNIIYSTFS